MKTCISLDYGRSDQEDRKTENGVPVTFKEQPKLLENRVMAITSLEDLKRRFLKRSKYKEHYIKFMDELRRERDAEEQGQSRI